MNVANMMPVVVQGGPGLKNQVAPQRKNNFFEAQAPGIEELQQIANDDYD